MTPVVLARAFQKAAHQKKEAADDCARLGLPDLAATAYRQSVDMALRAVAQHASILLSPMRDLAGTLDQLWEHGALPRSAMLRSGLVRVEDAGREATHIDLLDPRTPRDRLPTSSIEMAARGAALLLQHMDQALRPEASAERASRLFERAEARLASLETAPAPKTLVEAAQTRAELHLAAQDALLAAVVGAGAIVPARPGLRSLWASLEVQGRTGLEPERLAAAIERFEGEFDPKVRSLDQARADARTLVEGVWALAAIPTPDPEMEPR